MMPLEIWTLTVRNNRRQEIGWVSHFSKAIENASGQHES